MKSMENTTLEDVSERYDYFDFDIDGMVIKLDDMRLWKLLGHTEHHPRYAIAYKFPAKQVRTRVLSIEHSVGRTGTVTPVANLDPVEVTGVVVRRATLHNYDELLKKDVRVGDTVFIMRAGEVIPEIVSVVASVRDGTEAEVLVPTFCPVCNTLLEQESGKVAIFCPNQFCPAKIQGQFEMFVSKQGLNIDGLGKKQIERFLAEGWITDFASIFSLKDYRQEILALDGYQERSVQNLVDAIEAARTTTLDRVLGAIGIPHVGKKTAKQIANRVICESYRQQMSIPEILFGMEYDMLVGERDIGPETAEACIVYIQEMRTVLERLFAVLNIVVPASNKQGRSEDMSIEGHVLPLKGKSFCVTGSFPDISRDEIHTMIEAYGGEVRTGVSARLDVLIAGDKAGSKMEKARALGVCIMSWDEFREEI